MDGPIPCPGGATAINSDNGFSSKDFKDASQFTQDYCKQSVTSIQMSSLLSDKCSNLPTLSLCMAATAGVDEVELC